MTETKLKIEIEKMIDNMTIEELKAAARFGLIVSADLAIKTIKTLMKITYSKGDNNGQEE